MKTLEKDERLNLQNVYMCNHFTVNISSTLFLFKLEGQDTSMKKHDFMYSYSAKTGLSH